MKKSICFVVAVPITAQAFLCDHIKVLSRDYDIYLAGNINSNVEVEGLSIVGWHHVDIERGISLIKDLKAVFQLRRYFSNMRFDAVHSVTPKAGLVTALAGVLAGIEHRTHIFTGQVWCTRSGLIRFILKTMDIILVRLDNHFLVDGKSQRSFLIEEGVLHEGQAEVFGFGSISGVNSIRFTPDMESRISVRSEVGIKEDTICFIFLGRLNRDKGIDELYRAFDRLAGEVQNVFLLLVGYDEEGYVDKVTTFKNIVVGTNFYYYGRVPAPEKVLNAGDVFVLPTYREGFGTSIIEAASVGIPCISTDAYGVKDAYIDGETGLCFPVGDVNALYECMKKMYNNPDMIKQMGKMSRVRALRDFNGADLTKCWVDFYHKFLN